MKIKIKGHLYDIVAQEIEVGSYATHIKFVGKHDILGVHTTGHIDITHGRRPCSFRSDEEDAENKHSKLFAEEIVQKLENNIWKDSIDRYDFFNEIKETHQRRLEKEIPNTRLNIHVDIESKKIKQLMRNKSEYKGWYRDK